MRNKFSILTIATVCFLALACEKSKDFVADNTDATSTGYRPVSTNLIQDLNANPIRNLGTAVSSPTVHAAGSTIKTELQFFSQSPIKEINFYNTIGTGAKTKVATFPYQSAFSQSKRADTLIINYVVPTAASGTNIRLDYEIVNQNALTLNRTAFIRVQ
jgi:hypothetical protein